MNLFSKRWRFSARWFVFLLLPALFNGCTQQANSGGFSRDDQVGHAFRTGNVPAELNYYYTGRENMPYAIMGIHSSYAVPSEYWIAFEPEPQNLRNMSSNIYGWDRYNPYGFNLLSPDGTPVGIWFSNLRFANVRVDQANRTVDVFYKNPESYDNF